MDTPLLELRGINKSFPGVKALDSVSVDLRKGEILALLGENGAGKSTLLKILSGAYSMDSGAVIIDGKVLEMKKPSDAQAAGVSIIYQELNYLGDLSVAENIFLGSLPTTKYGAIDWKRINSEAVRILGRVGFAIDVRRPMNTLSVMQKQLVEIAKALSKDMRVLVMDEPTSSLNEAEVLLLVRIIKEIAASGVSVIFISHRLDELFLVADRVTVMRDGKVIGSRLIHETNKNELVYMMVGRELSDVFHKKPVSAEKILLAVENLSTDYLKDINFRLYAGEVLGIFGLMGAGREELVEALFGLVRKKSGRVFVENREVHINKPSDAIHAGIAYVPAERKTEGAILIQTIRENISVASLDQVSSGGILNFAKEGEIAKHWIQSFAIRTPGTETLMESLSGGNQQKVILGRWMQNAPRIFLLNDPTRGVDVGAKAEIYKIINRLCGEGVGVIIISSDMPELLSLSDTVLAMADGEIRGALSSAEVTQEKLMHLVVGGGDDGGGTHD
jgi:ABC-type sugar transport system ATPase subunit